MAKGSSESSNQLNLTVVALVALVAIVGLVALVMNAAGMRTATFSIGSELANAENLAGDARALIGPPVRQPPVKIDCDVCAKECSNQNTASYMAYCSTCMDACKLR
ncbi:TPA: hypothetical protein HA251_05340 [Candidatus Woesearchaeota archaeon]|nr:hypothetical protein [Candidatus Woesearchaeota archaeon]